MKGRARALKNMSARSILIAARSLTQLRAEQALGLGCTLCHSFATSTTGAAQHRDELESSEVEAVDPFLAKLQHQTEASYLELLSRKDAVAKTEEDALEEEQIEVHTTLVAGRRLATIGSLKDRLLLELIRLANQGTRSL